jgi:hypothetical protein
MSEGLSLVVALLVVPVSASASLTLGLSDACSMSCCVYEGHCCCSPRRARVKHLTDSERKSIESAQIESQCPEGCALLRASRPFLRVPVRTTGPALVAHDSIPITSYHPPAKREVVELDSSSPRAPPSLARV